MEPRHDSPQTLGGSPYRRAFPCGTGRAAVEAWSGSRRVRRGARRGCGPVTHEPPATVDGARSDARGRQAPPGRSPRTARTSPRPGTRVAAGTTSAPTSSTAASAAGSEPLSSNWQARRANAATESTCHPSPCPKSKRSLRFPRLQQWNGLISLACSRNAQGAEPRQHAHGRGGRPLAAARAVATVSDRVRRPTPTSRGFDPLRAGAQGTRTGSAPASRAASTHVLRIPPPYSDVPHAPHEGDRPQCGGSRRYLSPPAPPRAAAARVRAALRPMPP